MATARFHVMGDNMQWFQSRVQEEIHIHNLEGSAVTAGRNIIAVIVEGKFEKIDELYKGLKNNGPEGYRFSDITYGEYDISDKTSRNLMLTNSMDVVVRLLERIEENTREMNHKLDELLGKKRGDDSFGDSTTGEATSAFSSIFG